MAKEGVGGGMRRRPRIAKVPIDRQTMKSLTRAAIDVVKGRYAPPFLIEERIRICETCPYGGKRCDLSEFTQLVLSYEQVAVSERCFCKRYST